MEATVLEKAEPKNDSYNFKLDDFEGPLDLLLYFIKQNQVNLYDIPIAQITEQYLDFLSVAADVSLDSLVDFQLMAANLLYIKSRMLLPIEIDENEEFDDPRQELVENLIEYHRLKKLTELMEDKEREAEWIVERKKLQRVLPFSDDVKWEKADVWELLKTFSGILSHISCERIMDLREEVSINGKITLMMELIEKKGECSFTELLVRKGSLIDIVCAFLAILEAVKFRKISILQNKLFGEILIKQYVEDGA